MRAPLLGLAKSIYYLNSLKQFVRGEKASQVFSSLTNIRSRRVFPSLFNLNICTVNCTTETEGSQ